MQQTLEMMQQEIEHWKQRALSAEARLGINLPFATERLTSKQQRVFEVIEKFVNEHHHEPTVREVADMCELKSTSTAQQYLYVLERKGYIKRFGRGGFRLMVRSG